MAQSYEQLVAHFTARGAPFEIVTENVCGRPMKVFRQRERSMREKIEKAAERGELDFLVQGDRRVSYAEFARRVWGAGHALRRDHGLSRGDRIAIFSYNCLEWILLLFGATSVGAVGVGLNGWWASGELEYGLRDSSSRYLVVDERLFPRVEPLLRELPSLERIFYIGDSPPPGTIPVAELLEPSDDVPRTPLAEDDPFVLLYTSGTTGRAKGCITTHRGTIAQVQGILLSNLLGAALSGHHLLVDQGEQHATLLTSPLFHVAGLHSSFCTSLSIGAKVVFNSGRFDPEEVMRLIERERIASWSAIPTLLSRVAHHPKVREYDLSSLKSLSVGGAPTPPETIVKAREVLPIEPSFANAYGLTETCGVVTMNSGRELLGRMTSIGRPLPILEMRTVDAEGRDLPNGRLGELVIYGPTVTPGYWNQPEASAETLKEGWLHTGDLGYRDEEGFFFVVDRAKDMILRGGENVYCTEIEHRLADHPEVDEAAVVGMPDADLGERVKAIVRRVEGSRLDEDGVRRHVAAHLARFKVPDVVEFVDDPLPRNAAGKLIKNALRGDGAVPADVESEG